MYPIGPVSNFDLSSRFYVQCRSVQSVLCPISMCPIRPLSNFDVSNRSCVQSRSVQSVLCPTSICPLGPVPILGVPNRSCVQSRSVPSGLCPFLKCPIGPVSNYHVSNRSVCKWALLFNLASTASPCLNTEKPGKLTPSKRAFRPELSLNFSPSPPLPQPCNISRTAVHGLANNGGSDLRSSHARIFLALSKPG